MKLSLLLFFFLSCVYSVPGKLIKERIAYYEGEVEMEGYLAYDDVLTSKRPGVLVVHDWMGIGSFSEKKADALAKLGYVGFAVDIYGVENRPNTTKEAATLSTHFKENRDLLRKRIWAAIQVLKKFRYVDSKKIAAIGYCFGGTTVLELARSGAAVQGVVSFHGGLSTSTPRDAKNIKAKVLVLHGAEDPWVPLQEVIDFQEEMTLGKVDWQLISYGNAVHSFTNPEAGKYQMKGIAYDALADRRSWIAMQTFFEELLGK